jgi:hypothetical protein
MIKSPSQHGDRHSLSGMSELAPSVLPRGGWNYSPAFVAAHDDAGGHGGLADLLLYRDPSSEHGKPLPPVTRKHYNLATKKRVAEKRKVLDAWAVEVRRALVCGLRLSNCRLRPDLSPAASSRVMMRARDYLS